MKGRKKALPGATSDENLSTLFSRSRRRHPPLNRRTTSGFYFHVCLSVCGCKDDGAVHSTPFLRYQDLILSVKRELKKQQRA